MKKLTEFAYTNFLFLNNYYYHAPCLNFKEIEDIVNSYTEDDIDNDAFDWGDNCDMHKTPIKDNNIFPLIVDNLESFAEDIYGNRQGDLFEYIHDPWLNTYKKGQYQEIHDHAENDFSAVVFMNEGIDFGQFYFMDRTPVRRSNIFQDDISYPNISKGDIFIFPGHMLHGVSPHKNDIVRKTLSFNMDMRR